MGTLKSYASGTLEPKELARCLAQDINPEDFISVSVIKNRMFYHDFRTILVFNGINSTFTDMPGHTPVPFRIIKELWPDQYDTLTEQWTRNKATYVSSRRLYREESQLHTPQRNYQLPDQITTQTPLTQPVRNNARLIESQLAHNSSSPASYNRSHEESNDETETFGHYSRSQDHRSFSAPTPIQSKYDRRENRIFNVK